MRERRIGQKVSSSGAMRRWAPIFFALSLLAGCGGEDDVADVRPEPSAHESDGAALYRRYCALCHGAEGEGYRADNAPALAGQELLRSASDAYLTQAIAQGRPGTPMSAWDRRRGGPLSATDMEAIVQHMRSWQRLPNMVVDEIEVNGDATRGSAVYAQHCASCHGAGGEGVEAVRLANAVFLATASDGFLQFAVSHGRSGTRMPAFRGRLNPQQIDDVVSFVRSMSGAAGVPAPLPETAPEIPPLSEMQLIMNPDGPRPRFTLRERRFVPAAQVQRELARGARMIIIDARASSDWLQKRIPGSIPLPYYEIEGIAGELPHDGTWMIAYCACPHAASGRVVDALRERGFTNTAVLDEGINHWEQQGYPTANGLPEP